jgi:uncharacterized membrane protein
MEDVYMKRILSILGIISTVWTIGWAADAKAEITLCNRFDRPIYLAFSQKKSDRSQLGVIVKGWWYAKPGQCQTVYTNSLNKGENYGYYAISDDKKRNWSGENNSAEVCISDRGFDLMNAEKAQCIAPSYPVRFQSIDTKNRKNLTFDVKS